LSKQPKRKRHADSPMPRVVGFIARLYVLRPDEGGRTWPVFDGYRVQSRFAADQPWDNDVAVRLQGQEACAPGEECTAKLAFAVPDAVTVMVASGDTFVLREGTNVVVWGVVLEILYSSDMP
jgi:translation elongation factor EF-Tu-like GTPase